MQTLFDAERMTLGQAIDLTAESLAAYGGNYRHWALAYSGGKDSTCVLSAVLYLLDAGRVQPPKSLTVLYADTRMELPPLHANAIATLNLVRSRGYRAEVVLPPLDERYFVYMLGRGVPPPTNRMRWCTPALKVEPMLAALQSLRVSGGEKLLMLTGVRLGESAVRDARISLSCSKDGGECGQGWFQLQTPAAVADVLAPCLHWRICHVGDWLQDGLPDPGRPKNPHPLGSPEWRMWSRENRHLPSHGFPTRTVIQVYSVGGEEGDEVEINGRTGCVGCPLASQDFSLQRILTRPEWQYLAPLRRLKPLYEELRFGPGHRIQKMPGERRKDGKLAAKQGRIGPLTMDARKWALAEVLDIQRDVNARARACGAPEYSLIDAEEEARSFSPPLTRRDWSAASIGSTFSAGVHHRIRFAGGLVGFAFHHVEDKIDCFA